MFYMMEMEEADVILGIRIKYKSNGIAPKASWPSGVELKKINYFDCTPVSTPMDTREKLKPNKKAVQWVLKYLKKIMDYNLSYIGYPLVLEGYTDASWISNTKDNSSTSGRVFFLGGGAISWDSKEKTYITSSIKEYKFVALATAGKEAGLLKNFILDIPI
ncbi:hypothetical protein Tco_0487815 [Tanacetum coccineum]